MRKTIIGRTMSMAAMAKDLRTVRLADDEAVRDNARRHLAQRMGKLRGLPQKLGQILSMSDEEASAHPFSELTDAAKPLPFETVRSILESTWGGPIDMVVSDIDPHGRAASLGQVHKAVLHSGEQVAVKVAYPGIRQAVMNDLKMLGWLSGPVGDLRRGFDMSAYRGEIMRNLNEELDYTKELSHQKRYAELALQYGTVVVPKVFETWSSNGVLVSAWEDGVTLEEVVRWPAPDRRELAWRLLQHFLTMVFDHGFVHGDPHPGNYRFRIDPSRGPTIVLYDYGSVATLSPHDRMVLLKLIADTAANRGDPMGLLVELGFDAALLEPIGAKLPAVCKILFEPFCQVYKFDLGGWHRRERLDDVLGDDRWNFRMAGPARLILLMRAFRGVIFYLDRLGEEVSWERALSGILARHESSLATLPIPSTSTCASTFDALAKHLRIEVRRQGVTKVSLTFPAGSIENLPALLDDDLADRIRQRGIDIHEIVRNCRRGGYAPGELFVLEEPDQDRSLRVWME
ncbi:MAG: hypothetical protein IIC01_05275 [Planctomycetes bacterium]|nr:hypothetical protein [Planctomycetota bacterium]